MPIGNQNERIPGCGTHHVAVQTRDWDASLKLYQDVMGMTPIAEFGIPDRKIMLLDTGDGSHMELFQPTSETPGPDGPSHNDPLTHVAFATTDARAAIEHVRQAGYEVTVEPKDLKLDKLNVTVAFFKGPCGEILEFFQTR